jgi:hypothetical protein
MTSTWRFDRAQMFVRVRVHVLRNFLLELIWRGLVVMGVDDGSENFSFDLELVEISTPPSIIVIIFDISLEYFNCVVENVEVNVAFRILSGPAI